MDAARALVRNRVLESAVHLTVQTSSFIQSLQQLGFFKYSASGNGYIDPRQDVVASSKDCGGDNRDTFLQSTADIVKFYLQNALRVWLPDGSFLRVNCVEPEIQNDEYIYAVTFQDSWWYYGSVATSATAQFYQRPGCGWPETYTFTSYQEGRASVIYWNAGSTPWRPSTKGYAMEDRIPITMYIGVPPNGCDIV